MQTRKFKQTLSALVVFTSLLAGISSCKKDKDNVSNPDPVTAAGKLQEYKNGEDFIRFEYNADGSVKKATLKSETNTNDEIIDYNITYSADKKIASLETSAGEKIVPVYANGVLSRADVFEGTERTGFTNYVYENSQLAKATIYWGSGNDFQPFLEFDFTYNAAGNLSRTVVLMATQVLGTLTRVSHMDYQYDNKNNPLLAYKDLFALLWQAPYKNNIVQEDQFDETQQLEDRYTYTYTYKSNGLPQHAEVKNGLPGGPLTTTQVDYIYK